MNEAICYSDDIVNLSPIRWLQDPLAEYKKNSDWKKFENVRNHTESVEVIDAAAAIKAGFDPIKVYGIEIDKDILKIAHERLAQLGVPDTNLHLGDALNPNSYNF